MTARLALGSPAPPFSLPGVDGETHSLDAFAAAKALVVVFSCNHCPYVIAYEERLVRLASEYQPRGAQFIAINANDPNTHASDGFDEMKVRAAERGFPFPYCQDRSQDIARAFGATRTPEVFVFAGDRTLAYAGAIDDQWQDENAVSTTYLADALEAILAATAPTDAETFPVGCTIKWLPDTGGS